MFRHAAFAWVLLAFLGSVAQAGTYRFEVTGGFARDQLGVMSAYDFSDPTRVVDPTLTFDMIPDDQIPDWYASMVKATEGHAVFDNGFSRCSGLLTILCRLDFDRENHGGYVPPIDFAFDAVQDSFHLSFPDYDQWGIEIGTGGFFYSDSNYFSVRIGTVSYFVSGVSIWGDFTSVEITRVPVPGAASLLLPALGGFVALGLRRRRRARGKAQAMASGSQGM